VSESAEGPVATGKRLTTEWSSLVRDKWFYQSNQGAQELVPGFKFGALGNAQKGSEDENDQKE